MSKESELDAAQERDESVGAVGGVIDASRLQAELAEANDPYSERNQKAEAWDLVAGHPVIGPISRLPEGDTYAEMVKARLDELAHDEPAPSLPVHGTPEALPEKLRDAAYLVDMQFCRLRSGDRSVASILYERADELEAERVGEATHTAAIEKAAKVMADVNAEPYGWDELIEAERDDYRTNARALAEAGLLVDGAEA